ncbi:hypothetical protein [Pelagicoccus albus]
MKSRLLLFAVSLLYSIFSYSTLAASREAQTKPNSNELEDTFRALQKRLETLSNETGTNELLRLHFRSVKAQIEAEWARSTLREPSELSETYELISTIQAGFQSEASEWDAYLDGRRSLLMSYISAYDQSVQYYFLGLPKDWDPAKTYPLFLELHGAGNPHPLSRIAKKLGSTPQAEDSQGYTVPKVYAEIDRSGYWVYPFCRGNMGYREIAEVDVLETYDHIHKLFSIDPNRRYLYGFSMGGGGTWRIAQRTPDRWAAACSFAPSVHRDENTRYLVSNLIQVPFKIMTGSEDFLLPDYHKILGKLEAAGVPKPDARIIPGLPHHYLMDLQAEGVEWLKQFTRKRPDAFVFTTDDDLPESSRTKRTSVNECWGVTLKRIHPEARFARAKVSRENQVLTIETTGASSISLDFSEPDGLGMKGYLTIVLNGITVYQGDSKPLSFDI